MKYIKKYEKTNIGKPEVGDYIISHVIRPDPRYEEYNIDYFLLNNIGEILSVNNSVVYVKYNVDKVIPRGGDAWEFRQWFRKIDKTKLYITLSLDKIDQIFKSKEDAEAYLAANKYNL